MGLIDDLGGALEDAGNAVVDAGDFVLDQAGEGLRSVAELGEKTAGGLWDIAEDGFELVTSAVRECMRWLWDQVPNFILHPFGDPEPLRQAAAGWRSMVQDIERTREDLVAGGRTLRDWKGPAADRFDSYLKGLLADTGKLGDGLERIAKALTDAAEALADLNRLVHSVLAELAAYIAFDIILTALTGGIGAAAAAAQVAMMVARVTSAVRRAITVIRRVLPALREAKALQALAKVTFKVDDLFDASRLSKTADSLRKWTSTAVGNTVGTSVAVGRSPGDWESKDWISAVGGTVVSVRVADKLKPFWNANTRRGSDSLLAASTNGALASGGTSIAAQIPAVVKGDGFSLTKVAVSTGTGGTVSGASRAGTFRLKDGTWRGAPATKLSEGEKGLARLPDGLVKGGVRQPFNPGPAAPAGPGGHQPVADAVPKHPFGQATYTVRPGDNLTIIAQALLGDGDRWPELVGGSNPAIADPDLIQPGQRISLPR